MDEATEWRDKYDKNAKKLNKADVELAELRRLTEVLKQKAAEDAADGDACASERTRLGSEVRAHLINEAAEKRAREDSVRRIRELEEDLTAARIQRDRERREEESLRSELAQAREDVSLLEEELARHKRWKQQVEQKLKRLGGAGLEIARHSRGEYNNNNSSSSHGNHGNHDNHSNHNKRFLGGGIRAHGGASGRAKGIRGGDGGGEEGEEEKEGKEEEREGDEREGEARKAKGVTVGVGGKDE